MSLEASVTYVETILLEVFTTDQKQQDLYLCWYTVLFRGLVVESLFTLGVHGL